MSRYYNNSFKDGPNDKPNKKKPAARQSPGWGPFLRDITPGSSSAKKLRDKNKGI